VVAIASGSERLASIIGAARCGLLKGLATDERTARELVDALGAPR
jgi:DNA-binding transcriptional regulator LsrR (DeoR family)